MNMNKPPMTIAGAACGAVSLVLGLAAIGVPKWLVLNLGLVEVTYGLWRVCATFSVTGDVKCSSYSSFDGPPGTPGWIRATSAFEVGGVCGIFFALLLVFLHIYVAKNNKAVGKTPGPCAVSSGVIMIVGIIIWAVKYKDEAGLALCDLSVGFILAIVSAVLSIIAGILLFLGWRAQFREQSYTGL